MTMPTDFKSRFLQAVEDDRGQFDFDRAVELAAEYLSETDGCKVYPILRKEAPYDMVGLLNGELRLYLFDNKASDRADERIDRNAFGEQAEPLYAFLRSTANKSEWEPEDEIEKIVYTAVRVLSGAEYRQIDIREVSLHFITLNESADLPNIRRAMRFGKLLAHLAVRSLADLTASSKDPVELLGEVIPRPVPEAHVPSEPDESAPLGEESADYQSFKDSILSRCEAKVSFSEAFRAVLKMTADVVRITENLPFAPTVLDKGPCDFLVETDRELRLYILDRQVFERDNETVKLADFRSFTTRLADLLRRFQQSDFRSAASDGSPLLFLSVLKALGGPGYQPKPLRIFLLSFNRMERTAEQGYQNCIGRLVVQICGRSLEAGWSDHAQELLKWLRQTQEGRNTEPYRPRGAVIKEIPSVGTGQAPGGMCPSCGYEAPLKGDDCMPVDPPKAPPIKTLVPANNARRQSTPSDAAYQDEGSASEFRRKLIEETRVGVPHEVLFETVKEILCDAGRYEEISDVCLADKYCTGRTIAIDGYSFDEENGVLSLILLDDGECSPEPAELLKTDFEALADKLLGFFELSWSGELLRRFVETDTQEGACAYSIRNSCQQDAVLRLELVVVTMGRNAMRKSAKPVGGQTHGIGWSAELIDYLTLYELSKADATPSIDFDQLSPGEPVPILQTVDETVGYSAYVGRIAASALVKIYDVFGQRVLSGNVRAFLSSTNKVNKGMLETIEKERDKFFAYNNGICVVAESIRKDNVSGMEVLKGAVDFQIVNGGQTTATLHYAATKKNLSLDGVYVQMKLSVMPRDMDADKRLLFVKNISKYANSQSKVQDSDLGANTLFQIAFKKASEHPSCMFRTLERPTPFYWYYERSRGSYRVESLKSPKLPGGIKFEDRYPRKCKFDKTDLAKWALSFAELPNVVSLGAQKCFLRFSRRIDELEREDPNLRFVSPEFVRHCLGKGVVFRFTDELIRDSQWYKESRSYKANLIAYALALLARMIRLQWGEDAALNFMSFAETQSVPPSLAPLIDECARLARRAFNDEERGWDDVGEWVKKAECWEMLKAYGKTLTTDQISALSPYVVRFSEPVTFPNDEEVK